MDPIPLLGSLAAILMLAGLAWWLKLGGDRTLTDEKAARDASREVDDGFEPVDVALCRNGRAALLRDRDDRVMVLKRHGSHFAGRILGPAASVREDGDAFFVETGERRFGRVALKLDERSAWVAQSSAINDTGA